MLSAHLRMAALVIAATCVLPGSTRADVAGVSVDQFLADIQKVLIRIRDASDTDELPPFKSVDLTIRAVLTREADGTFKFHILEAGADLSDESVQELHLQLGPPSPADKSPVSASVLPLADAIIDAAREVKKAAGRVPPLHLKALEAKVEFSVDKQASGTLFFVGAKAGKKNTQTIVLTFE